MGSLTATKLLQALVGALLVPVVARLGRMCFGAGVAVVAAAFVAFDPVSTWYAAHFWAEPVFVLLLWFGIERVMAGDATGRLLPIATGGFAIGLAALTREPALYVLPLVAAWVGLGRRKRSLLQAGLLLAVALLTVAPWTLRNYVRYSAFVPVSTMGGRALLEGNADRTRGEVYAEYDEVGGELGPSRSTASRCKRDCARSGHASRRGSSRSWPRRCRTSSPPTTWCWSTSDGAATDSPRRSGSGSWRSSPSCPTWR